MQYFDGFIGFLLFLTNIIYEVEFCDHGPHTHDAYDSTAIFDVKSASLIKVRNGVIVSY